MVICGLGIIFSIIGTFFVTIKDETSSVQTALNMGNWTAMLLTVAASYFVVMWLLPEGQIALRNTTFNKTGVFASIVVGTIVGAIMSFSTEYYTAMGKKARPLDRQAIIYRACDQHHRRLVGGHEIYCNSYPDAGRRHNGIVLFCGIVWALRSQRAE
jgi:K(+)-stimulated pyrophosphate-energized sodium pump